MRAARFYFDGDTSDTGKMLRHFQCESQTTWPVQLEVLAKYDLISVARHDREAAADALLDNQFSMRLVGLTNIQRRIRSGCVQARNTASARAANIRERYSLGVRGSRPCVIVYAATLTSGS